MKKILAQLSLVLCTSFIKSLRGGAFLAQAVCCSFFDCIFVLVEFFITFLFCFVFFFLLFFFPLMLIYIENRVEM